ncbi:MAG: 30S ribosome-binding factor RbfA [Anaerolineaceae bacterium]|nr:30S ribosome-binding factor RbfA [Anaerolineaceae bacterium]
MPSIVRLQRISDRIKEELSELLLREIKDPRLSGVFVTDVNIDRELAFASIYVSALEGQDRAKEILEGLNAARGFIRRYLSKAIELRSFPQLRFHWDPTPEQADHMEKLFKSISNESRGETSLGDE